jgi:hypothetical protein
MVALFFVDNFDLFIQNFNRYLMCCYDGTCNKGNDLIRYLGFIPIKSLAARTILRAFFMRQHKATNRKDV